MPKMSGIDFLQTMQTKPLVIDHLRLPELCLEGFRLNVLDYC